MTTRRQFLNLVGLACVGALLPATASAKGAKAAKANKTAAAGLAQQVNQYLAAQRKRGRLAKNERSAWAVSDLNAGRDLVAVNVATPLQCASMVKPFVALAYLHAHTRISAKKYPLGAREKRLMREMLVSSSNNATNTLMRMLGGPSVIQNLLKKHYRSIVPNLQIVEYIPAGGQTYRNRASAQDYNRFLKALWAAKLPESFYLRGLMGMPNRDRLRDGTRHVPRSARIYDKTGTTARLCGNMGIVACRGNNGRTYAYTVVGIIERSSRTANLGRWSRERGNLIRDVSDMAYLDMAKRYPLG